MRVILNNLYRLAGGLAALCLVVIALLVVIQVFGRIIDGVLKLVGAQPVGLLVPSLAEIAGFLLVGASFLALASTFRMGDHIRVSILLHMVPGPMARFFEIWCLGLTLVLAGYFTWHAGWLAYDSYLYDEVSFGIIPIPLWIPQTVMTTGLAVFTIALLDDFTRAIGGNSPSYQTAKRDDAIEGVE